MRNFGRAGPFGFDVRRLSALFACALFALLAPHASASPVVVVGDDGARVTDDPYLPPREDSDLPLPAPEECGRPFEGDLVDPPPAPPARAAGPSLTTALRRARRARRITREEYVNWKDAYDDARNLRNRVGGRSRSEMSSVISVAEGIARRGKLTPSRMPAVFLQLRRNAEFWADPKFPQREDVIRDAEPCGGGGSPGGPRSPNGSRIMFEGSQLVFQYYAGSGLQIQPLANWGKVNGLYTACRRSVRAPERYECKRDELVLLLDELLTIRSRRGNFTTWEYFFHFGGGAPPWTSGLSQGTAIQALARASQLLDDPRYLRVAGRALGAFDRRYPVGVRAGGEGGGSHYLIYSFAPGLRVLNGFLQALTGLHDYASVAKSGRARALFRMGNRSARREIPDYDTGAWSLYSRGGAESTLGYHRLVRTFLANLCERTRARHYCGRRDRFTAYLERPPGVTLRGAGTVRARRPYLIRFRLNKVSCVRVRIERRGETVFRRSVKLFRGDRAVQWTPKRRGEHTITIEALSLSRVSRTLTRTVNVR